MFEILSTIQFSTLRLMRSQVPPQAVAVTKASRKGTVLGVNFDKSRNKAAHDTTTIADVSTRSPDVVKVIDC